GACQVAIPPRGSQNELAWSRREPYNAYDHYHLPIPSTRGESFLAVVAARGDERERSRDVRRIVQDERRKDATRFHHFDVHGPGDSGKTVRRAGRSRGSHADWHAADWGLGRAGAASDCAGRRGVPSRAGLVSRARR